MYSVCAQYVILTCCELLAGYQRQNSQAENTGSLPWWSGWGLSFWKERDYWQSHSPLLLEGHLQRHRRMGKYTRLNWIVGCWLDEMSCNSVHVDMYAYAFQQPWNLTLLRWNIVKFARGPRGSLTNQHHPCIPSLFLTPGTRWESIVSHWPTTSSSGLKLCQCPQNRPVMLLISCTRWSSAMDALRRSFQIRAENSAIRSSTGWKSSQLIYRLLTKTGDEGGEQMDSTLFIDVPYSQQQNGVSDCGRFAIAFAVHLAPGDDAAALNFDQSKMREHLLKCFQRKTMMPFPQTKAGPVPRPISLLWRLNCSALVRC